MARGAAGTLSHSPPLLDSQVTLSHSLARSMHDEDAHEYIWGLALVPGTWYSMSPGVVVIDARVSVALVAHRIVASQCTQVAK